MTRARVVTALLLALPLLPLVARSRVQARVAATPSIFSNAPAVIRADFGRLLEPQSTILHGAGQSDETSFAAYTAALAQTPPMLTMSYVDLKDDLPAYFTRLRAELGRYNTLLIPQIGLSLNAGDAARHYEADVAAGKLEPAVAQLCAGIVSLDRPVFVRIGYEFNGFWNGYRQDSYIAAYRHIAAALRACAPGRAANVWDWSADADITGEDNGLASADAIKRRDSFYPGDAWVDWWGMNLFSTRSITGPETAAFVASAGVHRFPVMIGESTPQHRNVSEGDTLVQDWFAPYFGLMRVHPEIKAFCYIDWDWRVYPQWADWGDGRIERNSSTLAFMQTQMSAKLFANARDRKKTLDLLRTH